MKSPPTFDAVNEARDLYLPGSAGLQWSGRRATEMARVVKAHGPTAPVDALHGMVAYHLAGDGSYDPLRHLTPETFWQAAKLDKYLDADRGARAAGLTRPYTSAQTERGADAAVRRILARKREGAGR